MKSAINVGKILRDVIEEENKPKLDIPKDLTKKKITIDKIADVTEIYKDDKGKSFRINGTYYGIRVTGIVLCRAGYDRRDTTVDTKFKIGQHYPINKDENIINSNGRPTNLKFNKFRNKWIFIKIKIGGINEFPQWKCILSDEGNEGFKENEIYTEDKDGILHDGTTRRLAATVYNDANIKLKFKRIEDVLA